MLCTGWTGQAYSQNIEDLFQKLNVPRAWKKSIDTDTSFTAFYNKQKVAYIRLINNQKKVNLIVFDKEVLKDTLFIDQQQEYNESSSCKNYLSDEQYMVGSFTTTMFYIVPELCPNCDFISDKSCKRLAKSITDWTMDIIK